jgi:hypothetical protein
MRYSVFLTSKQKEQLEYEVISQELRVHLTRLIARDESFAELDISSQNWLVNRSRSLLGEPIYVLESDGWGEYQPAEYVWHAGEFELCLRRLDTPRLIELACR